MKNKITIHGLDIEVASTEKCNQADWWVCVRVVPGEPKTLERSQEDFCTQCGHAVWFDPLMGVTKPPKLCLECAIQMETNEKTERQRPETS